MFLLGEYSVLVGGSALLVAIDRRARVAIHPGPAPGVHINTGVVCRATVEQTPILASAVDSLEQRGLFDRRWLEGHEIELDTSAFYSTGLKLGLGSSAALMVAIVRALCPGKSAPGELFELAGACHANFQGGLGSGADIATSISGGCIQFSQDNPGAGTLIPPDLQLLFVWTGEPAVTTNYIRRFNQWRRHAPAVSRRHLDEISRLSMEAIVDFKNRQTEDFIDKVSQFNHALMAMSDAAGLDFYSPAHEALRGIAEREQCVYKPSGAGGGDFGIVFSTDAGKVSALSRLLEAKGYMVLSADAIAPSSECSSRSNDG